MINSNLSKIKPKFRTEGQITGNWGRPKVRTNGNNQLGMTTRENISITKKEDYIKRMYQVLDTTTNPKLKQFAYNEIKMYMIQTGRW